MLGKVITYVGEAMLSALLGTLFGRLGTLAEEHLTTQKDKQVVAEIKTWPDYITSIRLVLDDAEEKQLAKSGVGAWLEDLEHLAYEMEDKAELFNYELKRRRMEAQGDKTTKPVALDSKFIAEVEAITESLKSIALRKSQLDLLTKDCPRRPWKRHPSGPVLVESVVYGREHEKRTMVKQLIGEDDDGGRRVGVIPIVGMGGLGKTTLARYVYNDQAVDRSFDKKAWVCVSQDYDVFKISRFILEAVTSSPCSLSDLASTQAELNRALMGKKFLIVVDDLWNDNHGDWKLLGAPFMNGAPGSRIIVTTRSSRVADIVRTDNYETLRSLSEEDCWRLFCRTAELDVSGRLTPRLEEIGKEIVKKCSGLPLAVITMGGVVRCKEDEEEWEAVLADQSWSSTEGKLEIMSVLRLSYNELPSHLKRCFAFCAVFPEDHEYDEEETELMWWGEGLVQSKEESRDCFRELVARSMLAPSRVHKCLSKYAMHDLVRDLAKQVSRNTCCVFDDDVGSIVRTRRLSFRSSRFDAIVSAIGSPSPLRILFSTEADALCTDRTSLSSMMSNLKYLRVLSLRCLEARELPHAIGQLVLLRQLDLMFSTVERLPDSITSLYCMEILILRDCHGLTSLPARIGNLGSLRYLDIAGTKIRELPTSLKQLKSLRYLSEFYVGDSLDVASLAEYDLVGELRVLNLENVKTPIEARSANVNAKRLRALTLEWGLPRVNSLRVIEELRPHRHLNRLVIKGYGGDRLPFWLSDAQLKNLSALKLDNCGNLTSLTPPLLKEFEVAKCPLLEITLPKLPSLETLLIGECKRVDCDGEFSLERVEEVRVSAVPELGDLFQEKIKEGSRNARSIIVGETTEVLDERSCIWIVPRIELIGSEVMKLETLTLAMQYSLEHLPQWLTHARSLRNLEIKRCDALGNLWAAGEAPASLSSITIVNCAQLESISMNHGLKSLNIGGNAILGIEEGRGQSSISEMSVQQCPQAVRVLAETLHNFTCLSQLTVSVIAASKVKLLLQRAGKLGRLRNLVLSNNMGIEAFPPEETEVPGGLVSLTIRGFRNLKCLRPMRHHCLQELKLIQCPELDSLSDERLPLSLVNFYISGCNRLQGKLLDQDEVVWSKVSHIDGVFVHSQRIHYSI